MARNYDALGERLLGAFLLVVGVSVLLGWAFYVERLVCVCSGCVPMAPNTALGFVIMGIALMWSRLRASSSVVLVVLGSLVMLEYGLRVDLGIDALLLRGPWLVGAYDFPGRMAPATAASFILAGACYLLVERRFIAVLGVTMTLPAVAMYAVRGDPPQGSIVMAVHTAGSFLLFWCYVLLRNR